MRFGLTDQALLARSVAAAGDPMAGVSWQWRFEVDDIAGKSDGDAVTTLPDSSGNSRDATQDSSPNLIYRTGVLNGHPVVRSETASNRFKTGTIAAITQPTDMFVVGSLASNALIGGVGASNRCDIFNSGGYALFAGSVLGSGVSTGSTPTRIIHARFNGASSVIRVGGGAGTVGDAGTQVLTGLTILGRHNSYAGLDAQIATVAVTTSTPSLATINEVGSYLATKYGLSWTTAT